MDLKWLEMVATGLLDIEATFLGWADFLKILENKSL